MAKVASSVNHDVVNNAQADANHTVVSAKEVPMNKSNKPLGPRALAQFCVPAGVTKRVVDSPARLIDELAPGNPEYTGKRFVAVITAIYDGDECHPLVAFSHYSKETVIQWLDSALAYGDALLTKGQRAQDTVSEGTVYKVSRRVLKDPEFHWILQDAYYHAPLFRGENPDMFTFGEPVWGETVVASVGEIGKPIYERRAAR